MTSVADAPALVEARMASPLPRLIGVLAGLVVLPLALVAAGVLNLGQGLTWIAFLAALTSGLAWIAATGGRTGAEPIARGAFWLQWAAYLGSAFVLWRILFTHDFQYQYAASSSSRSMPGHYVYAAFWGGQEGTFMLWAFLTATLGLVLMRFRHKLTAPAMLFLNLPLVMLGLVTV